MTQIEIEIPEGMTEEQFLKALQAMPKGPKKERTLFKEKPCLTCHFYDGTCGLHSSECTTAIFNQKPPTRFLAKSSVSENS